MIPNNLLDKEMIKMKDTELRIVLAVARKTIGWVKDSKTKARKIEDWISASQFSKLTSRTSWPVSNAIDGCIKNGWIEARNIKGEPLDTREKRRRIGRGGKIFYRLGMVFLEELKPFYKVKTKQQKVFTKKEQKSKDYKRNPITKENNGKANINLFPHNTKSKRKLNPAVAIIIGFYSNLVQQKKGFKPEIAAADGSRIKQLLERKESSLTEDDIKKRLEWYLGSKKCKDLEDVSIKTALSAHSLNQYKIEEHKDPLLYE